MKMDEDTDPSVVDDSSQVSGPVRKSRKSARSNPANVRVSSAQGHRPSRPSTSTSLQAMQTEMLLRTYRGNLDSFTGLDLKQKSNAPYASTSQYLRQAYTREKTSDLPTSRVSARTPQYKTQEEYYDEVIALKKSIQELNKDNSTLKQKLQRVEEDYIKKKREVEQLLDPVKNDHVRRTLAEAKPESGMVVHSMKQKILKLEEQVREKEAAYSKLQSDLKTTKFEETKIALEICYNEVQRLRNERLSSATVTTRKQASPKENASTMKVLTAQLKKSNRERNQILAENKTLREDLLRCMESKSKEKPTPSRSRKEYEDMNKNELLSVIAKLEKAQKSGRAESINGDAESVRDKPLQSAEGKVPLEGNVKQRLDQLDKRESDLLGKVEQQTNTIKKLKEDRDHYRAKCTDKDSEIKDLKKRIDVLQRELDNLSATRAKDLSEQGGKAVSSRSKSPRGTEPERSMARRNSTEERDRLKKAEELRKYHAAKRIQTGWKQHKADELDDESALFLQSAFRGHLARQQTISRSRSDSVEKRPLSRDESETDEMAEMLQSTLRAHNYRKQTLSRQTNVTLLI